MGRPRPSVQCSVLPPFLTFIVLLPLSCCRIRSDEEAVEEADDWSDTMPSSASVSDWLDSARSASASVMRLEVAPRTAALLKLKRVRFSHMTDHFHFR